MTRDFSRQSFLGQDSEEILSSLRVAIIGLCGGGSHVAQQLAHIGVGNLIVVDHDPIDASNLNRMVGAQRADLDSGALKSEIIVRQISRIDPNISVLGVPRRWQDIAEELRSCNAVFGCVDSYAERAQLEATCRRFHIPYFDIGMDVSNFNDKFVISGQAIVSMPGAACMRCMGYLTDEILGKEAEHYGRAGGRPQVIWPNGVLASTIVGMFVQTFTPWSTQSAMPRYVEYDGNRHELRTSNRITIVAQKECPHFSGGHNLGDPFFGRRIAEN
jgi:hypothetical protein